MHLELFGSSFTLNSICTQSVIALPIAVSGFFVVNGYVEISADDNVAELKNVVFPVFVFPIIPIFIVMCKNNVDVIYL